MRRGQRVTVYRDWQRCRGRIGEGVLVNRVGSKPFRNGECWNVLIDGRDAPDWYMIKREER